MLDSKGEGLELPGAGFLTREGSSVVVREDATNMMFSFLIPDILGLGLICDALLGIL